MEQIYANVFATLLIDCRQQMIPMVNEVHSMDYTMEDEVVLSNEEHYLKNNEELEKRVSDSHFSVKRKEELFYLYEINGKEKYRKAIELIYSQVQTQPRTSEGNFWHKLIYPNQVWLDGLYMVMPFYMEYETKFNSKKNYDDIFHQFTNVVKYLRDEKSGLYFHAYDASKTAFWCEKETGLCQNFWLRALGWYSMALLDTLDKCDAAAAGEQYDKLKDVFVDYIDSLLKYQDESGMWYQLPARGGEPDNYLETSGTAIFAYSMLKAVRLGFLPESYREPAVKAFQAIIDKYLTVDEAGGNTPGRYLPGGRSGTGRQSP